MRIFLLGNVVQDILLLTPEYPDEDSEQRIAAVEYTLGGNIANTARVLKQFDHEVTWCGVLPDNTHGQRLASQLNELGIHTLIHWLPNHYQVPTSYIVLNQSNGSRTIMHHRNMPELTAHQILPILDDTHYDWAHIEARNPKEQQHIIKHLAHTGCTRISLEIEKAREDLAKLETLASVIMYSRAYAQSLGYNETQTFLESGSNTNQTRVCGWGEKGAGAQDNNGNYYWQAANAIKAMDTLGAGDVFNAGIIHYYSKNIGHTLKQACLLAEKKCRQNGFDKLVKD